jgi:hypothetical protein
VILPLIVCVLVVVVYATYQIRMVNKNLVGLAVVLETELKEIQSLVRVETKETPLAYGWFDEGWPMAKMEEEHRAPIENPHPHWNPDEYLIQMWICEYQSFPSPHDRKDFVRRLIRSGAEINEAEFLDVVFADESPHVRAWAAAHLETILKDYSRDYTDSKDRIEIRNYETAVLADAVPIVRAALLCNPQCQQLPWSLYGIKISENWKEHFRRLAQLERLAMMQNPELSKYYIVALMETPSEGLNVSRVEHAEVLVAAAMNPAIIESSRRHGRRDWVVNGDWNRPFEEFGKMWQLSVSKWMDQPRVPYFFLKFITAVQNRAGLCRDLLKAKALRA